VAVKNKLKYREPKNIAVNSGVLSMFVLSIIFFFVYFSPNLFLFLFSEMSSFWSKRRKIKSEVDKYMAEIDTCSEPNLQNSTADSEESMPTCTEFVLNNHRSTAVLSDEHESEPVFEDQSISDHELSSTVDSADSDDNYPVFSDSESMSSDYYEFDRVAELCSMLAAWKIRDNVTQTALGNLLKILRLWFPDLPVDPRTVMQANKQPVVPVKQIGGGSYCHIGIERGIHNLLSVGVGDSGCQTIKLQLNIDGLPLFKSSNVQLWPILGLIDNYADLVPCAKRVPFVIGMYHGTSKPTHVSEYLQDVVTEAKKLQEEGLFYRGVHYQFSISAVVCDMPARSYVKCVTGHSGYSGCDKCTQIGTFCKCVTFPECHAPERTDESFVEMRDQKHHSKDEQSPFLALSLGMVSQFPIDYMHLVCLGVMRKLVSLWLAGPLKTRLGRLSVEKINKRLVRLSRNMPVEFQRKPRPITDYERWKATEFRMLLLYTGHTVLSGVLQQEVYDNYLLLSVAVSILVNPVLCLQYSDFSNKLLVLFVEHFGQLYGTDRISYNVHALVHLSSETKRYGVLDNVSAFPFENFLGKLKKLLRKPNFPLQQLIRRLHELESVQVNNLSETTGLARPHNEGPVTADVSVVGQYKQLQLDKFCIRLSHGDCHVQLMNGDVVSVQNIIAGHDGYIGIMYRKFEVVGDLFTYPVESRTIGIVQLAAASRRLHHCSVTEVARKYVLLPYKDSFVGMPLVHTA